MNYFIRNIYFKTKIVPDVFPIYKLKLQIFPYNQKLHLLNLMMTANNVG